MQNKRIAEPGDVIINHNGIVWTLQLMLLYKANEDFTINQDEILQRNIEKIYPNIARTIESMILHNRIIIPMPIKEVSDWHGALNFFTEISVVDEIPTIQEWINREVIVKSALQMEEQTERDLQEAVATIAFMLATYRKALMDGYPIIVEADSTATNLATNALEIGRLIGLAPLRKETNLSAYNKLVTKTLDQLNNVVQNKIDNLNTILPANYFTLDMPLVSNYVLEKTHSREDLAKVILEVRNSKEARAFRERMTQLDKATMVGDDRLTQEIASEITNTIGELQKNMGQETVNIQIAFPLSIAFDVTRFLQRINPWRKRHLIFIEQLHSSGTRSRNIKRNLSKLLH